MTFPTPITDRIEAEMESHGRRDVPVRVYQFMRKMESERAQMLAALKKVVEWGHDNGKTFKLSVDSDSGVANAIRGAIALDDK